MKLSLLFLTVICFAQTVVAQTYWQQHLDVKINVSLDDKKHFLNGYEEIVYTNNSHDTLHYIYMHLWPNAYKNDHTPFAKQMDANGQTAFYYSKPKDKGYIDSLQFTIDDRNADFYSADNAPDIARVDLKEPLLPGKQIKIATPFRVKVPKVFSRMGHTGQAYFISQWFPKPAVYDRFGWHPISYLDQGEFYSEYGTYDVTITLPKNYVVMATGNCTDQSEVQWLDEQAKLAIPSDTTYRHSWPKSDDETKTLHFHEDNVHDFAWFADKRWSVRKDTVVSPGNSMLVTCYTAFLPQYQKQWVKGTDYLKETVKHYGSYVGPYQYKTIKAVLGDMHAGGGMEYPTVTIIDRAATAQLKTVIIHEAGHNWFYGMLGTNERDHAWMDEGINTFYEQKTALDLSTRKKPGGVRAGGFDESLILFENETIHNDQAIEQTSANFTKLNYGLDVYYKTAASLRWLEGYMGKENFQAGMQEYYNTWHFKHPYPADLQACLQKHTDKPVDWFFNNILTTDKKIDFTVTKAHTTDKGIALKVRNNSSDASPVHIDVFDHDSLMTTVWSAPFTGTTELSVPTTDWTKLTVAEDVPDARFDNNSYRRYALLHRFGLKVNPFVGLNTRDKYKLFISPAIGYNEHDGFMAGLLFHNLTLPENRFRFALAPLYGFNSNTLNGIGSVGYLWYPHSTFKDIMLQGDVKSFNYNETTHNTPDPLYARYLKLAPSLNFTFKERDPRSTVTRTLLFKAYNITEDYFVDTASQLGLLHTTKASQQKTYGLIRYQHRNDRTYNPLSYTLEGQIGEDFAKISAEGNVRIDYNVRNKALYVRAFLGKFFAISDDPAVYSRYELNSTFSGSSDYLYDDTYLGRSQTNTIGAQQVSMREGGFKIPTYNAVGQSDNWLAALNLKTDLPFGKLPIRLFLDMGLTPNPTPTIEKSSSTTVLYDAGLEIHLVKNLLNIYIPILMSSDFQNYLQNTYGSKNVLARSISFSINLQNIKWLKAPEQLISLTTN